MTKKTHFLGRIVFSTTILLTAMWLPLTALALAPSEIGDLPHDEISRTNTCEFDEGVVGFGEPDLSNMALRNAMLSPRVPEILERQTYIGFAETDPAGQQSIEYKATLQATNNRAIQVTSIRNLQANEGFAELDPAALIHATDKQIVKRPFVGCARESSNSIAHGFPGFLSLTERGNRNEFEISN